MAAGRLQPLLSQIRALAGMRSERFYRLLGRLLDDLGAS